MRAAVCGGEDTTHDCLIRQVPLDAFIGLGLLAEEQGDYTAAADAYGKALAKDPQSFAATTGMGRVGWGQPGTRVAVAVAERGRRRVT